MTSTKNFGSNDGAGVYVIERPTWQFPRYKARLLDSNGDLLLTATEGLGPLGDTVIRPGPGAAPGGELLVQGNLFMTQYEVMASNRSRTVVGAFTRSWDSSLWTMVSSGSNGNLDLIRTRRSATEESFEGRYNGQVVCSLENSFDFVHAQSRMRISSASVDIQLIFCFGLVIILPFGRSGAVA